MIRLLSLDIDGTILDSQGQIPPANREAIGLAIKAGVEVALATGRRFDFARPIIDALPRPLTLILSNGAVVKRDDGTTEMRYLLPRDVARYVITSTPAPRETAAIVFDRPLAGQVVFERIEWDHPRHRPFFEANRRFLAEQQPLEDALTEDPIQVMFTGRCVEMRGLFDRLRREAADPDVPDFTVALTEYLHRDFSLVDITRAGCTKGSTLSAWAAANGYSRDEVMAVGDNLNDLEMLEFAGCPVVMGNGLAELKTRGWPVTAGNDEAGVARAIETFILRPAS
ncbi:MAG: HAD family hydrolase [Vicinamibacterales bacterium]